jgi:hypothetical protein
MRQLLVLLLVGFGLFAVTGPAFADEGDIDSSSVAVTGPGIDGTIAPIPGARATYVIGASLSVGGGTVPNQYLWSFMDTTGNNQDCAPTPGAEMVRVGGSRSRNVLINKAFLGATGKVIRATRKFTFTVPDAFQGPDVCSYISDSLTDAGNGADDPRVYGSASDISSEIQINPGAVRLKASGGLVGSPKPTLGRASRYSFTGDVQAAGLYLWAYIQPQNGHGGLDGNNAADCQATDPADEVAGNFGKAIIDHKSLRARHRFTYSGTYRLPANEGDYVVCAYVTDQAGDYQYVQAAHSDIGWDVRPQ